MARPVTKNNYRNLPLAEETLIIQPTLAKYLGINKAAIFYKIWYWTLMSNLEHSYPTKKEYITHCIQNKDLKKLKPYNKFNCIHLVKEGLRLNWVYNTYEDWQKQFPWLSVSAIQKLLLSLEKDGLLLSENYNRYALDKTKWYTISPQSIEIIAHYLSGPDIAHLEANFDKAKEDYKPLFHYSLPSNEMGVDETDLEDEDLYEEESDIESAIGLDMAQP